MLSKNDAYKLACDLLEEMKVNFKLKVLEKSTIEVDFGWVFFYNIDSEDPNEMIGGNAPIFVDKDLEKAFYSGTRLPVEDYISLYKKHRGDMEAFKKACHL